MGANYCEQKFKGSKDEVRKAFERAQDQDRYENGHSYSGGFGMCRGLEFAQPNRVYDEKAAHDWLGDNAQKWGPAIALRLDGDEYLVGAWCSC